MTRQRSQSDNKSSDMKRVDKLPAKEAATPAPMTAKLTLNVMHWLTGLLK